MFAEFIVVDGGKLRVLKLPVTQVVIRQDNGTPIAVAADYGLPGSQIVSKIGDDDFLTELSKLGINEPVELQYWQGNKAVRINDGRRPTKK